MNNRELLFARRLSYYSMNDNFDDDFSNLSDLRVIEDHSTVLEDAISYLTTCTPGVMRYPGKSYAIAYCYAYWLHQLGCGDVTELLDLPDLLNNDDPYFVCYSEAREIYDSLMVSRPTIEILSDNEYLARTRKYFLEEFMLDPDGLRLLPCEFSL